MIFKVGKSREKMSLTEFIRQAVNYDYLLRYRNLDFIGRQAELEEFVIKMIYQGEKILVSSMALKIRLTRFEKLCSMVRSRALTPATLRIWCRSWQNISKAMNMST